MALDILIIDDERDIRELISGILTDEGYETRIAADAHDALVALEARVPGLLILDIWLQGSHLDGLELLEHVKKMHADLPILMISGHGTIETAVSAIKRGAYDFIEKPFKSDRLLHLVGRALESARLKRQVQELKLRGMIETDLIGTSSAMANLRQMVERVAPTNSRILIAGPPGSGKEVLARFLHLHSNRSAAPFVALNAAAMAPERMERELFGVEEPEGVRRVGLLEQAHGGTLFIDEVADMPLETQAKILRVLVDQTFLRVGGLAKVRVDARIVSATSRDLAA
jgi:two-component system, NtrC family, nitrogen regulation response regulator NtrX